MDRAHYLAALTPTEFRVEREYQDAINFMLHRIDYERALKMPYTRTDLNLPRMRDLLQRLGEPHLRRPVVHVAGTKGKGSTTAFLSAALTAAGYRCGAYTSPHLNSIEERYRIDGESCTPQQLCAVLAQIQPFVEAMDRESVDGGPTFFEIATAIAFLMFDQMQLDVIVLEVGLGGRLDSTNVCQPLVSVITNISFDHMRQLGNTLSAIAAEKAGIIKPGVPVVSGATHPEAAAVIAHVAERNGVPLALLGREFAANNYRFPQDATQSPLGRVDLEFRTGVPSQLHDVPVGLLGSHQAANVAVAAAALRLLPASLHVSEAALRAGFACAHCDARIEVVSENPLTIVDSAHNVASAEALVAVWRDAFGVRPATLILAATRGKDLRGMLRVLLPCFRTVICTRYHHNPRAWDENSLAQLARRIASSMQSRCYDAISTCPDLATAWKQARSKDSERDAICITGSFFIAAEARLLLLGESA